MNVSFASVVACIACATVGFGSGGARADERIYVAKLRAAEGIDASTSQGIEQTMLVAAKRARPDLVIIGRSDVSTLADVQADAEAAGCETDSCAAEIADALGAPRIVTGQLSRVGSTWILSLTLLERKSLSVVARDSVSKQGESAEVLVSEVDALMARVLGPGPRANGETSSSAPTSWSVPLLVGGGVLTGSGALVALLGGAVEIYAYSLFADAQQSAKKGDDGRVAEDRATGEPATFVGWGLVGAGVVAVAGGIVLIFVGTRE